MNEEKIRIPIERRLKDCPFCGGHAEIKCDEFIDDERFLYHGYNARCQLCGVNTRYFETKAEAIEAWNRRVVTDTNDGSKEQPAKVINQDHIGNYVFGTCSICGAPVIMHDKYCSECGTKLDWSGNE